MTEEEEKVMRHLVDAWNDFLDLGEHHPDDVDEFRHGLHALQRQVMVRSVRRDQERLDKITHMQGLVTQALDEHPGKRTIEEGYEPAYKPRKGEVPPPPPKSDLYVPPEPPLKKPTPPPLVIRSEGLFASLGSAVKAAKHEANKNGRPYMAECGGQRVLVEPDPPSNE